MTIQDFFDNQTDTGKELFGTLDALIRKHDKTVIVEIGSMMSVKEALVYKQDDVFKYGLTATKNHFSYHSMVMYAFPEVLQDLKQHSKGIKFQKGCFNFKSLEALNIPDFEEFLKRSAQMDFSPVINHYKKKK